MGGRHDSKHAPSKLFFGAGKFLAVSSELRASLAYQSLSHASRLVLLDMLWAYGRASQGDTLRLDRGFRFTYGMCAEPIARGTFYRAIRELKAHGFFAEPLQLQPLVPGGPSVYVPSSDWRKFANTPEGQAAERTMQKFRTAKGRLISQDNTRRTKYYQPQKSESRINDDHGV